MPYNKNAPPPLPPGGLPASTKTWPFNPHPERGSRWQTLGYTTSQAQADRYSHLALMLHRMVPEKTGLRGVRPSAVSIFTRLRSARILPKFPQEADSKTLTRIVRFAYQYLGIKLKISLDNLNNVLVGESPRLDLAYAGTKE